MKKEDYVKTLRWFYKDTLCTICRHSIQQINNIKKKLHYQHCGKRRRIEWQHKDDMWTKWGWHGIKFIFTICFLYVLEIAGLSNASQVSFYLAINQNCNQKFVYTFLCQKNSNLIVCTLRYIFFILHFITVHCILWTTRHAICQGCMNIIRVKYFLLSKLIALNIQCFAENSVFAVFYGLLVTFLVAHRFTLGNPIKAIPIMYLLRVIKPWVWMFIMWK